MTYRIFLSTIIPNLNFRRHIGITPRYWRTEAEIDNKPVKYTTSEAAKWKAIYSSAGEEYFKTPRIQPIVVVMSLTAFMLYFCVFREENDLDDWLRKLERSVPIQVEEAQLRVDIATGRKQGEDVRLKEERLKEIVNQRLSKTKATI